MNYWAVTKKASTTKTLRSLDERPSRGRLPESQVDASRFLRGHFDSLAAEETTTATRTTNRAKKVGGQNLTLRRAVEDILRADWGRVGTPTLGEDVQDTVRREKEATKELRREMNLLLERRRVDALATRPPQNATAPDLSHSPWKSAADDVVFIDPSLLEGDGTEVRRSRAGKQSGIRAPWGGVAVEMSGHLAGYWKAMASGVDRHAKHISLFDSCIAAPRIPPCSSRVLRSGARPPVRRTWKH